VNLFEIEALGCSRGSFQLQIPGWQVSAGEFVALLGRNGTGKSTLLRVIAGEIKATTGQLTLHGKSLSAWQGRARARHLAVLPQASDLNFGFVAEEVVALGAIPLALNWRALEAAIRRVMEEADCMDLKGKPYPQLSGGEKQRIHFARVLLQLSQAESAPLLLLDEPTSAQDLKQQHHILARVKHLSETGYGVVAVLHDLNQALNYTDRCTLMQGGNIVADGPPEQTLTPTNVSEHWGYPVTYAETASGQRLLC